MKTNSFNETVTTLAAHRKWATTPLKFTFRRSKRLGNGSEQLPSIYRDHGVIPKDSRSDNFNKASDDLSKYQKVDTGDLVVNKMKAWQGSVAISDHTGIISPAYFVYRPTLTAGMNARYLHYLLRSGLYFQHYGSISTGVRPNQWDLDPAAFERTLLLRPPTAQQAAIADYLDHETAEIDAFIMDLDSFISLLHESLGAIRSELFGLPTTHEAISLKRLARQVSGSGFPHDYQGDPAQEIPFFKVGSLKDSVDGKLTNSPNTVSTSTAKALGAMILPENTVVLAKIGAALFLNRTARLGKPSCIDNNMLGLIPHPSVNPEFLQGIISNMDLVPLGNPGAVPSLNMAWYREQPAWLPSYTNQQEIVETYRGKRDDISSLITGANRAIDLARERRAALITAAVTGQIDVTAKNKPAAEQIEDHVAQGLHREYA